MDQWVDLGFPTAAAAINGEKLRHGEHIGGWVAGAGRWFPNIELAVAHQFAIERGPRLAGSYVYFLQAGIRGPVKIGWAIRPEKRLRELQIGASARLKLLLQIPGGQRLESELHREFADYRLRGEWFEWCPPLRAKLKALARAFPLPPPQRGGS